MEDWLSLLLAAGLLAVLAGIAYLATRVARVDDISPIALDEVLGKRDRNGHVTRG